MRYLTTRGVMVWTAVPLIVAQIGCAARGVHAPAGHPASEVSAADRKACEGYARATSAGSPTDAYDHGNSGMGLALVLFAPVIVPMALLMAPIWIPDVVRLARSNEAARQARYDAALQKCFEASAQGPLGPEMKPPARPWNPAGSSGDAWGWADRTKPWTAHP